MKLNWKTACTCLGCIIGAVCITVATGGAAAAPSISAIVTAIGAGGAGGFLVGNKIDTEEKKVKNTAKELEIKGQTIESIRKDNETKQAEIDNFKKQHKQQETENENLEKQAKEARNKANNSDLPEEERKKLKAKAIELEEKLTNGKKKSKNFLDQIQDLQNQISTNNKTISAVGSSSYGKDKGVWEFLTLENILIAFAIYTLWQIIKEDKR